MKKLSGKEKFNFLSANEWENNLHNKTSQEDIVQES